MSQRRRVRWRANWALAQITGVLFSTVVWVVLLAAAPVVELALLAWAVTVLAAPSSRLVLWVRYGGRKVSDFERDSVLRALVPVPSLRGRAQPMILVASRIRGWDVLAVDERHLLVTRRFVNWIVEGALSDVQASTVACQALGQSVVWRSGLVVAAELYITPWRLVSDVGTWIAGALRRVPLMKFAWMIRPIVFGAAIVQSWAEGQWPIAVLDAVLLMLTYTTGRLDARWARTQERLADQRALVEGFGPDLAAILQRRGAATDLLRVAALTNDPPRATAEAARRGPTRGGSRS